jgi:putative ABC transport system ATP-binding protein
MEIVWIKNLKKDYGSRLGGSVTKALRGINLSVEKGEFLGVMGPSGSGKTTFLNCISTIDTPTSGHVRIGGEDILALRGKALTAFRRDKLGFVFQDFNLLDTLTLEENILLPLALARLPVAEIEGRVAQAAHDLGLEDLLGKYPYEVSMGQKQRAAVARAIVREPHLVLADEPTGSLDSKSGRDVLTSFARLNRERQTTVLMVTHDPFAASFCSRVVFLKDGLLFNELVSGGKRGEFFDRIMDVLAVMGGDNREHQ